MYLLVYLLLVANAYMHFHLSPVEGDKPKVAKRDSVKASFSNRDIYHIAEFTIGSNNQKVGVRLDSLLNALIFPAPNCSESEIYDVSRRDSIKDLYTCDIKGTFDSETLKTFKKTNKLFDLNALLATYTVAGYFGKDEVTLGNFSTEMEFGIATQAETIGSLGLGFPFDSTEENFTSFSDVLLQKGVISRNAYSLHLGANNASQGSLLYGAADHSKYDGTLQKVQMINFTNNFKTINILFDGIQHMHLSEIADVPVMISVGDLILNLPGYVFLFIVDLFKGFNDESTDMYRVPCSQLQLDDLFGFYFSGVELRVPFRDLVMQVEDACYLSVESSYSRPFVLGRDILRSAYLVVDLEGREVAMAQAVTSKNERKEEPQEIVSSIPLAVKAPLYTYTEVGEVYTWDSYGYMDISEVRVASRPSYSTNTANMTIDLGGTKYAQTVSDYNRVTAIETSVTTSWATNIETLTIVMSSADSSANGGNGKSYLLFGMLLVALISML